MRGVTLLAGLALLGSLAVPAGLLAGEQRPDSVAGEIVPAATEPEPAPADAADEAETETAAETDARAAASRTVLMEDIEFKPRKIRIDPGDSVQWENRDEARHDAIGENGSFETPVIGQGETSSHTFNRTGKFPYFCSIHQGMTGTIQVGSSSAGGGGGGGAGGGGRGSGGASSGSAGVVAGGSALGGSSGSSSTGSLGSSGSSAGPSSLAATGSELLWLGLVGWGLLALGAFVRLAAIGR